MSVDNSVTVLHVSDMQFGDKHRFGEEGASAADRGLSSLSARLLNDLRHVEAGTKVRPDLVVASGDLAEYARPAEFGQVAAFLGELAAGLGLDRDRVIMVPGNHDINWNKCRAYFLNCEDEEDGPVIPYWPKYGPYSAMFDSFYRESDAQFPCDLPWTLFRVPGIKTVVAGLNSTIVESHREQDHYGFCGEEQLRWFAAELAGYEREGWLRIGVLHHNPVIQDQDDHAFLKDNRMFEEVLAPHLNLVLHGHTHEGRIGVIGPDGPPTLGTGSAGVRASARPEDVPNQYQLVRIRPTSIEVHARRYNPVRFRWEGDTAIGKGPEETVRLIERQLVNAHATFLGSEHAVDFLRDPLQVEERPLPSDRFAPEPDDLLARVQAVCRVRHPDASAERIEAGPGRAQSYLRVTERRSSQVLNYPIGVIDGLASAEAVNDFLEQVDKRYRAGDSTVRSILVHAGARAPEDLRLWAAQRGVDLQELVKFQGMYNLEPYADRQAERLAYSDVYPPRLFVPQRFSLVSPGRGEGPIETDLLSQLREWIADPDGRFVVVLGDFGHGKTFLLRELTRVIHQEKMPPVIPILIQLRDLEKAHGLEELLAAQLTAGGEELIDHRLLRHLIREGRVLLMFDGFDELALRVTYREAAEHLSNLVRAGAGKAKVVVTSRTQHFLADRQVETTLAKVTDLPGRRLVKLHEFDDDQILAFLTNLLDGDRTAAAHRLELIRHIRDLLGLSRNPRMLSFIVRLDHERLEAVRASEGAISAARLYEELLSQWLEFEYERARPPGSAPTLTKRDRWEAVTALALLLWESEDEALGLTALNQVSGALRHLAERQLTEDQAAHVLGSGTLLIRTDDERFKFVHRSVMEWLVADHIARSLAEMPVAVQSRPMSDLMAEFLCGRADGDDLRRWARRVFTSGGASDATAWNALLVARRLGISPSALAEDDRVVFGSCDLSGIDLSKMDLRGAALKGCKLRGARLDGANLSHADLRGADLREASVTDTDFSHADLRESRLARCSGTGTRFTGSDLREADLSVARLPSADLKGAEIAGAHLWRANLVGADLDPAALDACATFGAAIPQHPLPDLEIAPVRYASTRSVEWSPDGRILAAAADDGMVRLWDPGTGRVLRTLEGHAGLVLTLGWSPGGDVLAAAGDGTVWLWDPGTGRALRTLEGHAGLVRALAWSPGGDVLAAAGDGTVSLWDPGTGRALRTLEGDAGLVRALAWSPGGDVLAAAGDGTVSLWDPGTGRVLRTLGGDAGLVLTLGWSPGGDVLAAAVSDGTVSLWDPGTGRMLRRLRGHTGLVHALGWSPGGDVLAAAGDGTVRLWDPGAGRMLRTLEGHAGLVLTLGWSPGGDVLAAAGDGTVRLWDPGTGRLLRTLGGDAGLVRALGWSPGGDVLAAAGDGTVRLWDPGTGRMLRTLEGDAGLVHALGWSPGGDVLAAAGDGGMVWLWDPGTGRVLGTLGGDAGVVRALGWSPGGDVLAAAGDGTVRLWDPGAGRMLRRLRGHTGLVRALGWSPGGDVLAAAGDGGMVWLWDPGTGRVLRTLGGDAGTVRALGWSPGGDVLAAAVSDGTVRLWDPGTGRMLRRLRGHTGLVHALGWSPGGDVLAAAVSDGTVRLWDPGTGRMLRRLRGHTGLVHALGWSPDGDILATVASDGVIRLWGVTSSTLVATLIGLRDGSAAIGADKLTYKVDGTVQGEFWWSIGLCPFAPGELDPYVPELRRLPADAPLAALNQHPPGGSSDE